MREVNFSIPNVNKASVGITTALYDRRALDCTSTLPLINSLNHLAYLTTSSARIRDILTIDGGVERLVCILKQGRSQEMMEMWKWNLAFQCVVNIGVRGSESVRTRVVEADMVPVIATILDNYIQVIDKCREKAETEATNRRKSLQILQQRSAQQNARSTPRSPFERQTFQDRGNPSSESRSSRRHDPPPSIEIPQTLPRPTFDTLVAAQTSDVTPMDITPTMPQFPMNSPQERTNSIRHHHHHHHHHHYHHRGQDGRHHNHTHGGNGSGSRHTAMAVSSIDAGEGFGLRPVRDADRLPSSMLPAVPALQTGITSQPESPTTPSAPSIRATTHSTRERRRPPARRQQQSNSGDSDDANGDEAASETSATNENLDEPMIDIQPTVDIQQAEDPDSMLDAVATTLGLTAPNVSEGQETETFNITHQSVNDGSIINANATPTNNNIGFAQPPQPMSVINPGAQIMQQNTHARYLLDRSAPPGVLAATPRDEDVLMSLQLLAYVSKYCNLRTYFQQSHLVPKLKIGKSLNALDDNSKGECFQSEGSKDEDEEYLLPDDFNIFPLVEKFTVRHHSQDMQHWAGVVMRNLCRKDDARGGIRQCAYYECGRWEQWTRQFAKCRRCRRTKYCSKECQKNAWIFHRMFALSSS